jgi:FkbM family methyltransferase
MHLWYLFNRDYYNSLQQEMQYYKQLISLIDHNQDLLFFDVGANEGQITNLFLNFDSKVVSVEPDYICQKILKARFSSNKRFTLIEKGLSNHEGRAVMHIHKDGSAINTLSEKWKDTLEGGKYSTNYNYSEKKENIDLTTLSNLINLYGVPQLIKIDVEGHEYEVIQNLKCVVPVVVFEANMPEFLEETIACIKHLDNLDKGMMFNYSYNFKIEHINFITSKQLILELEKLKFDCIDIICKSNVLTETY